MQEKPLLLSSVKGGLFDAKEGRGWLIAATVAGVCVVVFGAADVSSRVAHAVFGENASLYSFGSFALIDSTKSATTTPVQTRVATATPLVPIRLQIPSIGVNAEVEQVGQKEDGTMGTPKKFSNVAWYAPGPMPGQAGNAVIDGHVNNALTTAGVFAHLNKVTLGDTIVVFNASGTPISFVVTKIQEYPADMAPSNTIFATTGPSGLVLITCDGSWVPSQKSFDKRLVVFASLK
jgi:LPXTG-site transpeptidase (sortase) family protein